MSHFPLFVDLQSRHCLVIGAGPIALRKIRALLKSGTSLSVVATRACAEVQALHQRGDLHLQYASFDPKTFDFNGVYLVVAATDDHPLNKSIGEHCKQQGIHCNVASGSEAGDVVLPSIIDRSPMMIALHSGGRSPTMTRYLKRQLEAFIPRNTAKLVSWAESWRTKVKAAIDRPVVRQRFWDRLLSGIAAEHVLADRATAADSIISDRLAQAEAGQHHGEVFLVGAGPGDPELLTLKALRLIQQADVVLYDRLVSEPILSLLPVSCERIYVGKRQADHALPQDDINQTLVDLAKQGRNVLRLKGGDPFIFGRGGEEIELLAENNVAFQVVPGITAASGCASYSGIPLTHRDYSQSVRFVTGHLRSNEVNLPWPELAQEGQTLVFYMGLTGLSAICQSLIDNGREQETPAAVIERGTTPEQRVIVGNLESLPGLIESQQVKAPTLLIIGEVVALHGTLSWYKSNV
ncbi:MAG: uroporphyrinogen-III C-methyltransferase [Cellvibrionaceae bacterium]|nr:uroporphyrinogen-III C-methyltransferase [Cellvibrionaceae bacterium]